MKGLRDLVRGHPKEIVDNPEGTAQASEIVKRGLRYVRTGKALDIGAGEGRNSLFLARNGFKVTAMDTSERRFWRLRENAKQSGIRTSLRIRTLTADATQGLSGQYNVIVSSRMLNLLPNKEQAVKLIRDMKEHTVSGGINIIEVPTKDGDFYMRGYPSAESFYPEEDELKQLYSDWNIREFDVQEMDYVTSLDGLPEENDTALLIAQKP